MFTPFRMPFFFTPLILGIAMVSVGDNAVRVVKYNVDGVKVISPGDEECWAGNVCVGTGTGAVEEEDPKVSADAPSD